MESWIRKLDGQRGRAHFFVTSIALLGTLLLGSSIVAWQSSKEQQRLAIAHRETLRILAAANAVKVATLNTIRGERGYLITGEADYLEPYVRGRRELAESLDDLDRNTRGDAADEETVRQLRESSTTYLDQLERVVALAESGRMDQARGLIARSEARTGILAIDASLARIIQSERERLHGLSAHVQQVTQTLLRFIYLMSFAGLCLLVISVVCAIALRRSFIRELGYREELRRKAETDDLTGVANRRELLAYLDKRIAEARRTNTPLSFAMFDIDNFKRVNDTYGHTVGDEAIRHVVRQAQATVRINDRIGRMGGEEFGIVLPKSSEQNAYGVCDRMLTSLRDHHFSIAGDENLSITISTGIAALTDEDDAARLIERADKALYEAKRNGRNQVKLAA